VISYHEFEAPEGWAQSTLGAVAHLVKDKVDPAEVPDDSPYVGLEHVEAHTMKLLGHGRASDVKSTKTRFRAGDVLYGKLRPYLNKVTRPDFDGICSTDFLVFGHSRELDRGYLAHYLNQLWVADGLTISRTVSNCRGLTGRRWGSFRSPTQPVGKHSTRL
jgi:type I restriction enzyme, S subunit